MMENGKTVRWMDKVFYIILMGVPMKEILKTQNKMDMAHLLIKTKTFLGVFGGMEKEMVKVLQSIITGVAMKANLLMIIDKERVLLFGLMELFMKEIGRKAK